MEGGHKCIIMKGPLFSLAKDDSSFIGEMCLEKIGNVARFGRSSRLVSLETTVGRSEK